MGFVPFWIHLYNFLTPTSTLRQVYRRKMVKKKEAGLNQFSRRVIKSKQVGDIQWIFKQHFASNSLRSIQGNITFLTQSIVSLVQQLAAAKLMHVSSPFSACEHENSTWYGDNADKKTQDKKHLVWRQHVLSRTATANVCCRTHGMTLSKHEPFISS